VALLFGRLNLVRGSEIYQKENTMKLVKILFVILMELLLFSSVASARDFDWIRDFNIQAEADPSGFRARLGARFQLGDIEIRTVLGNVEKPADAYMVLRLGEMSSRPIDYVMKKYKAGNGKGWGVLAKSLGIKPGSKDFHALKQGQDLYDNKGRGKGKAKGKGKGMARK
jgi:hypothetical protein